MPGQFRRSRRVALTVLVWAAVLVVPLIPMESAPVVPDPTYRFTWVSLLGLCYSRSLLGVTFRSTALTLPALIGVLAAGSLASWWLNRRRSP